MSEQRLPDDQLEALADLIADRLSRTSGELIAPAELAHRIGATREFVYDHADKFAAIRIGDGMKPRLWFLWPQCIEQLMPKPQRKPARRRSTRDPVARVRSATPLLPIKQKAT